MKQLQNKTFGNWRVVSYAGKIKSRDCWKCKCICGKVKTVQERTLVRGDSTSCGCVTNKQKQMNITGKIYGRLLVKDFAYIKNNRSYWNCVCDCGKEYIALGKSLVAGNTKSCGCIKHDKGHFRKNLNGKKFGELVPFEYLGVINNQSFWKCKCSCGNIKAVYTYSLLTGRTKSCGCRHYVNTDTKFLANKFDKHKSTISSTKWKLFGEHKNILNETEIEKMTTYFDNLKKSKGFSKGEKEILNFIRKIYKGNCISNDRNLIAPKEIDIYMPDKLLAIEYNGLFWHSEKAGCFSDYHLEKTNKCREKGIRLIHIYENEWRDKKEIVKSMIASALGIYKRRIFARKCEVREVINKEEITRLFNENHLQGTVNKYKKVVGLYYEEELVQACMFGKQHFGKNDDIELYRMVTLKNTQVIGGFSKIMKHSGYEEVVSYVSLRTFDAKGYYRSGWKLEHTSNPSFCITDGIDVYSRHLFKKQRCLAVFDNVDDTMTEKEMQIRNGFYRLWDCGTYKVRWKFDNK